MHKIKLMKICGASLLELGICGAMQWTQDALRERDAIQYGMVLMCWSMML